MTSQRRLKLRVHSQTEESLTQEGELSPELIVAQDLGLVDGAIVVLSQSLRETTDDSNQEETINELILKAKVLQYFN